MRVSVTPLMARSRGAVTYTVVVTNDGTGARRVGLDVSAPADAGVRVSRTLVDVVVEAGGRATTEVTVTPRRPSFSGPPRPRRIVVHARPDAGTDVSAAATHFQEPVRWRPAAAAVVAVAAVVVGLLANTAGGDRPLPPRPAASGPPTSTIAASGCPEQPPGAPARVDIAGFAFCPASLTVAAGTEVAWANADLSPHTATFDGTDGSFDSGPIAKGQTWSRRFDRAGVYQYYCRIHPGMSGTIVVT
jgi:plastocyanin